MEKLVYLLWREAGVDPDAFRDRLLGTLPSAPAFAAARPLGISVTDSAVAVGASLHLGAERPDALVTFWLDCARDRAPCETVLAAVADRLAGFLVAESHPLRLDPSSAREGERLPGFSLVGCIEPKPGVSLLEFATTWERVHRDVAIETQSTFAYVRNEVVRPLTEGAPPWRGVVEEGFPLEALEDPQAFYDAVGDSAKYERHLKRMIESCDAFLDMKKVDSHPMSAYRFD